RAPELHQPAAAQPGRSARALRAGADPGDEPGTARQAHPLSVPDPRRELPQGAGHAVQDRRDRRAHPPDPGKLSTAMNDIVNPEKLTRKDFATDQDVRWCPGCGDYSILA